MKRHAVCCLILAGLAVILFGRGLFSAEWIVSDAGKDTFTYFYHRYCLAREYRLHAELPAWNPYIHCGAPAMGTFQYSLWYPFHWLGMFLPVPLLINWMVFIHVCLAGIGMYGWCVFRRLRPAGALVAGIIYMMCGPLFSKVPVGDIPHLCVMAISPFIFWGIDGWLRLRQWRWIGLAAGAVTLQLLSGYPPLAFYTALAAGGYCLLELGRMWREMRGGRRRLMAGLLAIYPLALLLSAVEWLPAVMLMPETTRGGGLAGSFATIGAMTPEQLLLLIAPKLFGGFSGMIWWGNEHFYSIIAYCGAGGLMLGALGWLGLPWRERWRWAVLLLVPMLIAFGPHTPLFTLLEDLVPFFSRMRSLGRVAMLFALFMAPLAGMGFECLADKIGGRNRAARGIGLTGTLAGMALLGLGLVLLNGGLQGTFHSLVDKIVTHPGYAFAQNRQDPAWWEGARNCAAWGLIGGGGWLLWFGAAFLCASTRIPARWIRAILVASVALEMLWFAKPLARYYPQAAMEYPALAQYIAGRPGEWRDLNLVNRSADMSLKTEGIWGYEAMMQRRHGELMAFSQGLAPELGNEDMPQFKQNSRLFQLLRCRYMYIPTSQGIRIITLNEDVLPRFLVVPDYRVMTNRDEILATLDNPNFDFRRQVILETDPGLPHPTPAAEPLFLAHTLSSSDSRWEVEVTTFAQGVLLMTDSYAKGWHAKALPGSVQQQYELLPADYAVRGIPLTVAGKHLLEIKYTPPGFALGFWISGLTLLTLAAAGFFHWKRRKMRGASAVESSLGDIGINDSPGEQCFS